MNFAFAIHLLVVFLTKVNSDLNRDLEWLSFCPGGDGKKYIIHDTGHCPLGVYFKSTFKDLCVCGNGLWKMSTDICGKNWIIDAEDGDCFEVPESHGIRWIRYLGHAHEPKKEFNFVSDATMTNIVPMSDSTYTDAGYATIGTVNPRRSFSDCNNELCYKMDKSIDDSYQPGEPLPRFLWAGVPKNQGMYALSQCIPHPTISAQQFTKGIPRRGSYYNVNQENSEIFLRHAPSEKCQKRCSPQLGNVSFDEAIWGDGRISTSNGVLDISQILYNPFSFNDSALLIPKEENLTTNTTSTFPFPLSQKSGDCKLSLPLDIKEKQKKNVVAQTQRMAEAHFDAVIMGKRAPLIIMPEFEYLRTGRLIFEKVCPAAEVMPNILKSLLVLFRVALNESLTKTPYEHLGDAEEDTRLKTSLDACLTRASTKHFKISYNVTHCPAEFDGFFLDQTPAPIPLDPNIPCDVKYIPDRFDYPVEVAWKLGMFTHYFCAQHFNVTAFDHSRLEYKLRQLFNKDIIKRWYHPGRAGKVFQHIFHDTDLDKFMSGLDRCVAGAKFLSPYINWIKRPKFEGGIKTKNQTKKGQQQRGHDDGPSVLKGLGKCFTNFGQIKQMGGYARCAEEIKPPKCKDGAEAFETPDFGQIVDAVGRK